MFGLQTVPWLCTVMLHKHISHIKVLFVLHSNKRFGTETTICSFMESVSILRNQETELLALLWLTCKFSQIFVVVLTITCNESIATLVLSSFTTAVGLPLQDLSLRQVFLFFLEYALFFFIDPHILGHPCIYLLSLAYYILRKWSKRETMKTVLCHPPKSKKSENFAFSCFNIPFQFIPYIFMWFKFSTMAVDIF